MSRTLLLKKTMTCVIHTVRFFYTKAVPPSIVRFFYTKAAPPSTTPFSRIRFPTTVASTPTTTSITKTNNPKRSKTLNTQQQNFLKAVSDQKSVFLTGSAGTGKSFILIQAIELLKQIHNSDSVFVTASTGVAACALSGQTLHSFAGVGLGDADRELLLKRVYTNKTAHKRWQKAKALVIDEISMISSELFDSLEYIARKVRHSRAPWGGIQLIASGDFFQLPPVLKNSVSDKEFAFEAESWNSSFSMLLELTEVFRQVDKNLVDLLQGIRKGVWDEEKMELLKECGRNPLGRLVEVPRLYPKSQDVKRVNEERLQSFGREKVKYKAVDTGCSRCRKQLKLGIAPDELEICVGARVMLIRNKDVDGGLVNGSTGTVTCFVEGRKVKSLCSADLLPKVKFDSGLEMVIEPEKWQVMDGEIVLATRRQIPLILAWALSIHKCQGTTLDCLHTDLSKAFGCGMVYVALSRVRSLDGLYLSGFSASKVKVHPKVLQFYKNHLCS